MPNSHSGLYMYIIAFVWHFTLFSELCKARQSFLSYLM